MRRRILVCALPLLAAITVFLGAGFAAGATDRKPSIVHISADNFGWKDVGFNGCKDFTMLTSIHSPRVERSSRSFMFRRCVPRLAQA